MPIIFAIYFVCVLTENATTLMKQSIYNMYGAILLNNKTHEITKTKCLMVFIQLKNNLLITIVATFL